MNQNVKKVFYGVLLTACLGWIVNYAFNYDLDNSELKEYTGTLSKDPEFYTAGRGNHYMRLKFINDENKYLSSGIGLQALDKEGVKSNLHKGTIVTILVANKTGVNEYLDGIVNVVDIYGLKSEGKDYLKLDDFNEGRKSNRPFFFIIWFVLFGFYIYNFWIKNKTSIRSETNDAL